MLECPKNLLYSHRNVWVDNSHSEAGGGLRIGLSHYYLEELPEILGIDMPMVGDELEIDRECVHLHLENSLESVFSPLTGHVTAINRAVLDNPGLLHLDPYKHWLLEMEFDDADELDILVDASRYVRYVESL